MTELPKRRLAGRSAGLAACAALSLMIGQVAGAAETATGAAAGAPTDIDPEAYTRYCVAMSLARAGKTEEALNEFLQVVRLDPGAHRAWLKLGSIHDSRNDYQKAEESYAKAVELAPGDLRSRYELGRVQLLLDKPEEGLKQWKRAAEVAEGGAAAFVYQSMARYYQRTGDGDSAIEALKTALKTSEKPMQVARSLADLQERYGKWPAAVETYTYMLELQPETSRLHVNVATCYEKVGRWKDAVAAYDAYFATDPPRFRNYRIQARAAKAAHRAGLRAKAQAYLRQSVAVLDKALAEGEKDARVYSELASLFVRTGQAQKAIDTLKKGLEGADDRAAAEIHKALADVYLHEGSPDNAEGHILAAIKLAPDNASSRAKLAALHVDMLRFEEAVDAYVKAVDLADGLMRKAHRAELAETYVEMKEYEKAEAQLDLILKKAPEAAAAWAGAGQVRKKAGRYAEAANALLKAIELGAPDPLIETRWRLHLAEAYAALRRPERENEQWKAIDGLATGPARAVSVAYVLYEGRHHERAISLIGAKLDEMSPGVLGPARSLLSLLYEETGKIDLAEKELQQAIEENPGDAKPHRQMAYFLERQKRYDEALEVLEKAKRPDADDNYDITILMARANVLDQAGRVEEAEKEYKQALEEYPDLATVNNNLSYFYAQQGRELEAALRMVRKALRAEPDSAAFLDTLGWVLYKMGEYDGAVLKIHQAYQMQKDAVIAEHLGDALLKLGRKRQTLEQYKRALEHDPKSKEIPKKIQEVTELIEASEAE